MDQFNDNDKLNISGDWDIFYGNNLDQTFSFPPTHTQPPLRVRFENLGAGDQGGHKFKGKVADPKANPIEFQGETFYLKQGRQVMSMLGVFKPLQWVQVHAGKNQPNPANPKSTMVVGVAMDRGGALPSGGETESGLGGVVFKMIKVRPS